jgi:PH (Pleckstrin Homology) domain-containing protein
MDQEDMLERENIEKILSPHPLSFMGLQSLCIFLIVWGLLVGWLVNFSEYSNLFENSLVIIALWSLGLLIVGIIASILTILWRIFFLYLAIVISGVGLGYWLGWIEYATIFYPMYTVVISIVGFLLVECFRRSHKYIITNQRIVFKGGIITKEERTLRYDKITDINSKQGIIGQIFSFGTIIPISQSGFGLGSDSSFAAGGVALGEKKGKLLGIFGGGKEVQTPRTRSYYELHGVYPYKEVKMIVENLVQGSVITPYQQEQVKFQEQQVDLQKEMRDLLKKQQSQIKKPMNESEEVIEGENEMM